MSADTIWKRTDRIGRVDDEVGTNDAAEAAGRTSAVAATGTSLGADSDSSHAGRHGEGARARSRLHAGDRLAALSADGIGVDGGEESEAERGNGDEQHDGQETSIARRREMQTAVS